MNLFDWIGRKVRGLPRSALRLGRKHFCPVCGKTSARFARFGLTRRPGAQCVHCQALERHRLVWLYFERMTDLFRPGTKRVLHVAPEPGFVPRMKARLGTGYLTADLDDSKAMVRMDITDIHYPDESFDVIYCSHVLEHVPDDRKAMGEFHRVLKQDGWAILLVPITAEETVEDPSVTDPAERLRRFGQEDHVRRYGPDYRERLEEAGFSVTVSDPSSFLEPEEIERMGIGPAAGEIYHCTK